MKHFSTTNYTNYTNWLRRSSCVRIVMLFAIFNCQFSIVNSVRAQDAFYVYRNDGLFDGFFFDEVVRMGYSKFDLNSVEHDVYVVQEIETADSLYRIPLAAIDSIGFQQPDIILNNNLYEIDGEDSPVCTNWKGYYFTGEDGYTIKFPVEDLSTLPKVGMVLYSPTWHKQDYTRFDMAPFVGKVVSVELTDYPAADYYGKWFDVVCEPITDLTDVFEQLISVEQVGTDEDGNARRRMAGMNKLARRVSGNRDVTLLNLNGTFPFSRGNDVYSVGISLNLSLKVQATVTYNISRKVIYIGGTITEDAELGVSFGAKYNIEEITTWHLGGLPVYFPSILPVFQIDPSPQAFIKTTGDVQLSINSPKYAYHGKQTFHLGTDGVSGSCETNCPPPGSEDNRWTMELSLNGSLQAGSNFPWKLETNRWAKKGLYAAIGADVFVGPKLSASFTVDLGTDNNDIYNKYKGTNFRFSPMCTVFEASAIYSFRGKPEKKEKFFEGEKSFFDMTLRLFPEFEKVELLTAPKDGMDKGTFKGGSVNAKIKPRGLSAPCIVGLAAYNWKKELVADCLGDVYAFYNTFDEQEGCLSVLDGKYSIVPIVQFFGRNIPAWGSEIEVERTLIPYFEFFNEDKDGYGSFYLYNVFEDDKVEFELVKSYMHDWSKSYVPDDDGNPSSKLASHSESQGEAGDKVIFTLNKDDTPPFVMQEVENRPIYGQKYNFHAMYKNTFTSSGEKGQTANYSEKGHSESGIYQIKITRADGRVVYTEKMGFTGSQPN